MTTWRVRLANGDGWRPVLVEGDPETPRSELLRALRSAGHPVDHAYVDGRRWASDDTEPIGESDLHAGSTITELGGVPDPTEPGTYVAVLAGPGSGRAARLTAGRPIAIGRAAGAGGLTIDDPLLSGRHLEVELLHDGQVEARDLDSTNGSRYEAEPITTTIVERGCLLHAGASLLAVTELRADHHATTLGTTATGLSLHRRFREALPDIEQPPQPPAAPRDPDRIGGTPWWRSLMPLVTAVGFAVMFGRWQFLLIAALAPIVYAVDNRRRRRALRRDAEAERERYEHELREHTAAVARYRDEEVRRARTRYPGGGMSALLARYRHRRVWERRPSDPDFLTVTLGFAALPSGYTERHERRAPTVRLWNAPLSIALTQEGPLSIVGPAERLSGVARSLLVELAVAHAPVDLQVWVFAGEARAEQWEFAQWLPHASTGDGGARAATTPPGRSTLMQALRGLIESRREQHDGGIVLPAHVVVIDGVDTVPGPDLTELLRAGPEVGVVGIVTDASVVPEGVRGEIRLGRFDDECSYRSVVTPRVEDVAVSQLSPVLAEQAALGLAPLEAFARTTSRSLRQVYFTELGRLGDRTPEEQAEFWRQQSPRTSVPVGVGMDGQPFEIDIVRHGPHGLIGGMTRSGKTEFLKTWFSSLALHNHPDDLAIAIIDFKGGVDHRQTSSLPHVIALATNQNIDLFERTVTLLTAEHDRRQRLFDEAEVSTLEGYRTARRQRPELAPLPRLIVVVDEFVELLETPEGKAQIGRLESIARIGAGLGVHLVLVTQNFSSQLPPQIDGQAGLRICFKVESGADSKVVLRSAAAAGISAATKGRGYARFTGGDAIEFQSARVGNERRDRAGVAGRLAVHVVTPDTLTAPPAPPEQREVPDADQDLHRVVQLVRAASASTGHAGSAVPWPVDLPTAVGLDEVSDQHPGVRRPIGLSDDPARQRIVPVCHDLTEPVIHYAGAAGSGHHEALLTTATAIALDQSADDLHIYGIDLLGQGLGLLDPLPHVGTVATRDDQTSLRILGWLVAEAASRRSAMQRGCAPDFEAYRRMGGTDLPRIVLLVAGADRLFLHGEGATSPLLHSMTALVNEAPGTGIQVVFSGTHAIGSNRLGTAAGRRLVFAANDPAEYPSSVPKPLRGRLAGARRCVDTSTGLLSQVARVCGDDVGLGEVLAALAAGMGDRAASDRRPRTFTRAPWPLQLPDLDAALLDAPPPEIECPLPLGIEPDTGDVVWLDPHEDGRALRLIGGPKSGRSNALAAVGAMADAVGWQVVTAAASRRSPFATDPRYERWRVPVDELADHLAVEHRSPVLVLIDDAHRLADDYPWTSLVPSGRDDVVAIVAGSTEALTKSTGVMRSLAAPNGVVLMPTRSRDASGVGVGTIDEDWVINPLAGIGVAGIAGEAHRVQFPLVVG